MTETPGTTSRWKIFWIYLRLGCLSFGGPVAHMAYYKDEFVKRRKWLDEAGYAELLGLCQFIPGPSSSQLGFAIAWNRGGLRSACLAWLGFTLPSACLMIGFAYGIFALDNHIEGLIHGLLIAAVAVVANASLSLGRKLCTDLPRILLALGAASIVLLFPGSLSQIAVILAGAMIGQKLHASREKMQPMPTSNRAAPLSSKFIILTALSFYTALLVSSFWMDANSPGGIYALHYRAGALVFGGGHVVLPLLNDTVVAGGLIPESRFLAGYSAAQALPGPLFTFSAFLGTVGGNTSPALLGGILALIAIFLPGLLLLVGLLPFWNTIREKQWAQAALTGANAAVVGLLVAALIHPVWTHGIQSPADALIGLVAFIALSRFQTPAWLLVICCGMVGYIFY